MIRPARFADIPVLARLLREMHGRSTYAGRATLDDRTSKAFLMNALQRNGGRAPGATLCVVAERGGEVVGFLLGLIDHCYHVLAELYATDLFFYVSAKGDPFDASRLLGAFLKWAETNPRVIEIRMGITDALGDPERTSVLYERYGLERSGLMYGKLLANAPAEVES